MTHRVPVRTVGMAVLLACALTIAACGGSSLEGTYTNANGLAKLDLKSGGGASFTIMGESHTCTYQRNGATLTLTCPNQEALEITVHEDGSLTPVGTFIGSMTKSK